jgi:hypothetical protein
MNKDFSIVMRYLHGLRRMALVRAVARQSATLCAVIFFSCTAAQVLFAVFPWTILPIIWDILVAGLGIGTGAIACILFFFRRPDMGGIARLAEKRAGCAHPWLSLSIELMDPDAQGSPDLKNAAVEKARESLALMPSKTPLSRSDRNAFILLAVSCVAFAVTAVFLDPVCARYWKTPFSYFTPVRATILPGTVCVPSGSSCILQLSPRGEQFPSCRLTVSDCEGAPEKSVLLAAGDSGRFSMQLDSMTASVAYKFTIGNTSFPADTIRVVPRPFLARLQVRVMPPSYTGIKPADLLDGQGNFTAYPGTRVHFSIGAPQPLKRALFVSLNRDTVPFAVSGCDASGDLVVSSRRTYTFAFTDTLSQTSDSVPFFSIDVIPDDPPFIAVVKPGKSRDCTPAMRETLYVEATDDIGLASIGVHTRKNSDSPETFFTRDLPQRDSIRKLVRIELPLGLSGLSLYPGDTLFYWASACDNRTYGGHQCTVSDTFFFRVPTFEEIHERIAAEQDYTEHALSAARKRNDGLQQSLDNLMKSSQGKQPMSWEQKQVLKDLKEGMAQQADSLSKAIESFKEAVEKIKQQDAAPSSLLSKMDEVQKALDDLRKQYGDSLLFDMPKNADNVSLNDLRENLEKFKKTLPDLAKRLENTLKFLQMLKRDQELARMAGDAQRLAREQQEVASSPQGGNCLSKQENVCNGVDGLLKDIDRAAEKSGDSALFSKEQLPALGQLCPLQKNMRSGLAGKNMPGKDDMNSMSGSLMSLSDNLSGMQSCAMAKRFAIERETLMDMAHDALSMSQWQESITNNSRLPSGSAGETAALEQALRNSCRSSMEKMNDLAMVPPRSLLAIKRSFDSADASVDEALSLLSSGGRLMLSREPEARFNDLAKTVLDALALLNSQQQNSGSGMSGMMSGLRRLSSKQAMLNAATGGLLRSMLGQNGESEGSEGAGGREGGRGKEGRAGEKAREEARQAQKAIADELKRLADKYGKEAGASVDKKTRELEEEARRLSNMFDNPSQELRDRQDRFLSRLLETAVSQHRQDEGKEERVSQSAKIVFEPQQEKASGPASSFDLDTYFRLRQKAFSGNFPESYRLSVKNYFDSLGVLFLKEK